MTPDRWRRISAIYNVAIARSVGDRMAYVSAACGSDEGLRRDVESLLAQGESFLGTPVALPAGSRLGSYELACVLGAGGMGVVYRARDTRLQRDVALKVLPEAFASDPDRIARFTREAQVLASLNHPYIAAIYGVEESGGTQALVLELVDGPTLADRIANGPIPLDEALAIARQIAEALEAAHEHGVVHRDLKPANIKVRPDGTVKVLDFGLAKLVESASGTADRGSAHVPLSPSLSPTVTSPVLATGVGVLLGTAAYMSPEQARGKAADQRSDIWAFGCVLFEMLTGQQPFETGETVSDAIASILTRQPDWSRLPATTPQQVRTLLRRCLEKAPKDRLPHIGVGRMEIDDAGRETRSTDVVQRWRRALPWAVTLVSLAITIALSIRLIGRGVEQTPANGPETRVEITTPETSDPISLALSPDGRRLVFVAPRDGQPQLWLRTLDSTDAQPLGSTERAFYPFWSPDSKSIGFFADGKLKRLDVDGGAPQVLTDAVPRGGSWNADGVILFTLTVNGPISRVSAAGGNASTVVPKLTTGSPRFPLFLPDSRHFLFYVQGTPETNGIYIGSLDSDAVMRLTAAEAIGGYVASGWLLFVRQAALLAQRFDATRGTLSGNPVIVANAVASDGNSGSAVSIARNEVIAYRSGGAGRRQLTWFDRSGKALGTLGQVDQNGLTLPRLSPDGHRVSVSRTVDDNADLWIIDEAHTARFTFDPGPERTSAWSPDGRTIVFDSDRTGRRNLYTKSSAGGGDEKLLRQSPFNETVTDWSSDGHFLSIGITDPDTGFDIGVLSLQGDRKAFPFLKSKLNERNGVFSPDGRWVAYSSNESGRYEVYLRPFPAADRQWPVSTGGGIIPRFSRDGKELYYLAPSGMLMAARLAERSTELAIGAPLPLFPTRIVGRGTDIDLAWQYDVAPDGRFLVNVATDEASTSPITLIMNWKGAQQ